MLKFPMKVDFKIQPGKNRFILSLSEQTVFQQEQQTTEIPMPQYFVVCCITNGREINIS